MVGGVTKAVHLTPLGRRPALVAAVIFRGGQPLLWSSWRQLLAAQDTLVLGTRKIVASLNLAGEDAFALPDTPAFGTSPYDDFYESVAQRGRLTPGSVIEIHALAIPSGGARRDDTDDLFTADGRLRARVIHGGTDTIARTIPMPGSHLTTNEFFPPAGIGLVPDLPFPTVFYFAMKDMVDDSWIFDSPSFEAFSEGVVTDVEFDLFGGARLVDVVAVEFPWRHAQDDEAESQSVHAFVVAGAVPQQPVTVGPQERAPDVGIIAERRFGTHHLLDVAERQQETIGPKILEWSAWRPGSFDQDEMGLPSLSFSSISSTPSDIWGLLGPSWDPTFPGFLVDGLHAQSIALGDPATMPQGRQAIPVRVRVLAQRTGGTSATIRCQSSETEWVDVTIGTSLDWHEAVGWLETQATGDQSGRGILQIFRFGSGSPNLDLYAVSIDHGWLA